MHSPGTHLLHKLFPLRAVRRLTVLARRQVFEDGTSSASGPRLSLEPGSGVGGRTERRGAATSTAFAPVDDERDGDADGKREVAAASRTSSSVAAEKVTKAVKVTPPPTKLRGRRTGYGRVESTPINSGRTTKSLSIESVPAPPDLSHIPPPVPLGPSASPTPSPRPSTTSRPDATPSFVSSSKTSRAPPLNTHRRREEEDYQHAVRMETARRSRELVGDGGDRARLDRVIGMDQSFGLNRDMREDDSGPREGEGNTDRTILSSILPRSPTSAPSASLPRPALTTAVAANSINRNRNPELPSDSMEFYREWQLGRMEDEIVGEIRKGRAIGQRMVLPTLLDKASKIKLARHQGTLMQDQPGDPNPAQTTVQEHTEVQIGSHHLAPHPRVLPNICPGDDSSSGPAAPPSHDEALGEASVPGPGSSRTTAHSSTDLKLKLTQRAEKEVRGWIRKEMEDAMAEWERRIPLDDIAALSRYSPDEPDNRDAVALRNPLSVRSGQIERQSRKSDGHPAGIHGFSQADVIDLRDKDALDGALPDVDEPVSDQVGGLGIRRNPVGVQLLSSSLHHQLFPGAGLARPPRQIVDISLAHLADNGLSPEATSTVPEISFDMPPLVGKDIRAHFRSLGDQSAEPYLGASREFASTALPKRPQSWSVGKPGWVKYKADGSAEEVADLGGETMICFDVETMYLKSPYAVMATAATPNAWYSWLSPALFAQPGEVDSNGNRLDFASTLIPLTASSQGIPAVIVGHNVGYDRARVLEEYRMELSPNRWLDTLSLHAATTGITSVQRPAWQLRKKEKATVKENLTEGQSLLREIEDMPHSSSDAMSASSTDAKADRWEDVSGPNSLATVADLHCGIKLSKDIRNRFGDASMESATEFMPDLQLLLDYCASDVATTHSVLGKVLPLFLELCPHPASFAGALGMGNSFLPIDENWAKYLEQAEGTYQEALGGVQAILAELAYALKRRGPVEGDLWTEQLDWTEKVPRWTTADIEGPTDIEQSDQREQERELEVNELLASMDKGAATDSRKEVMVDQMGSTENGSRGTALVPKRELVSEWFPRDWEAVLKTWTYAPPSVNKYGDVLPYILGITYQGFPLISHPEHRWIVQVPLDKVSDPQLDGLARLDVPSEAFEYFKPSKVRISSPFAKARQSDWTKGRFNSPYRSLVDKLLAGAERQSVAAEIEEAGRDFANLACTETSQVPQDATPGPTSPRPKATKAKAKKPRQPKAAIDAERWPKWFWDLTLPASKLAAGELDLTVRKRVAPLLLRMAWKGHPLAYSREHGWTYRVKITDPAINSYLPLTFTNSADARLDQDKDAIYCKVPHSSGDQANVGNPLSKNFLQYITNGTLASAQGEVGDDNGDIASAARHAMQINAQCSYWTSSRERITSQMAVYAKDIGGIGLPASEDRDFGMILPQVITMGTVTRRAVESTWLTASNAKKNRVGSELKSMIRAPPGYAIVGADVDSEELWIASVMGDAQFGMHGASAIGWMTLEGTKAAGTDLHSKTAGILGTSRDYAKVFNYSRIYGAGKKHAMQLLIQNNADLPLEDAKKLADDLYTATKGKKTHLPIGRGDNKTGSKDVGSGHLWHGGSESYLFNTLEAVAYSPSPMTPGLGAGVTLALRSKFLPKDGVFGSDYLPSRINWVVQSSGVDYLHMLIVSMDYLIKRYGIQARYMISVHDEVRYMVKEEDKYRAALALQVANAWTRALLSYNLGLDDLPQSVAFFSAVDIDHVFRKEVDMTCVTPSHPTPLAPGESMGIERLLEVTRGSLGPVVYDASSTSSGNSTPDIQKEQPAELPRVYTPPNLRSVRHVAFLEAQASKDGVKVRRYLRS